MSKTRKIILIAVCAILFVVLAFSGYKLYSIVHEYKVAERMYNQLGSQFVSERDAAKVTSAPATEEYIDPEVSPIDVDFNALLTQCEDIRGWIYSPNTMINYPIAQAEDNSFYSHRFLDGTWNSSGTLFVDCLCTKDFSNHNNVVYGHHMNDGSMFASLCNYKNVDYYTEHPVMYLSTPDSNYRIEIFAGYITPYDSDTYAISFADDNEFLAYVEKMRSQSDFETDVEITPNDKLITLTTCTYEFENARYVIQGKLVKIH